jgi:hypothetical protein
MYPEIGVPEAAKRGRKSPDRPLLGADEALLKGPRLFPKQFWKENSRKSACRILQKSTQYPGPMAWTRTVRTRGGRYYLGLDAYAL